MNIVFVILVIEYAKRGMTWATNKFKGLNKIYSYIKLRTSKSLRRKAAWYAGGGCKLIKN